MSKIDDLDETKEFSKWFDQFKDEKGEWLQDHRFLEGLKAMFYDDNKEKKTECAEEEFDEDEMTAEDEEMWPKDSFMEKLQDFTDVARDFLMTRKSTLISCKRPHLTSKPNFWFYKEFREYLEEQNFIDKMVDVLVQMFSLHPELPPDPLRYIRDNFGISKKDEDRLIADWNATSEEVIRLSEEGKSLKKLIIQIRQEDASSEGVFRMSDETETSDFDAESAKKDETVPVWDESESSSESVGSELQVEGSEELMPEDELAEHESCPSSNYQSLTEQRQVEESSSSLDIPSSGQ